MSKKLQCIQNLKSKLTEMKKELSKIQNKTTDFTQKNYQTQKLWLNKTVKLSDNNNFLQGENLSKSPSWKNPTFWGSNPIVGKQNYQISSKWLTNKSPARNFKRQVSPQVLQLRNFCDDSYYDHTKNPQKPVRNNLFKKSQNIKSQKQIFSFYGSQQNETPRFEKIKTYNHPPTNPILNTQKSVQKGKRIVTQPTISPASNLIQNPKSNPSLYFFKDKVSLLSPKNSNKKNLSPFVKQLLSSSLEQKVTSPKKKSCKKHFTRYFKQTYECKWN